MSRRYHRPPARRRAGWRVGLCSLLVILGAIVLPAGHASAYTTVTYNGAGPNAPRISVIGDSVGSGIRWTGSYAPLTRFNFTFDAESCRRTIAPSCRGREGYAPENVVTTMRRLGARLGDVLVLMTGYNDAGVHFGAGVDAVMAEAGRQGVHTVIWLTMRTADVSYVSPGYVSNSFTFRDNNRILLQKAEQYRGTLEIADWASYSAAEPSWVGPDGVHLSVRGAPIAAAFIADMAGRVLDGSSITPPAAPAGYAPAVISTEPGRITAFVVGGDRSLYANDLVGDTWTGFAPLGGTMTSTPAAISRTPGTLDVFARGTDYALWTRHFDGSSWGPWGSLGGTLRSGPAVISRSPGVVDVFVVGTDRALWQLTFDGWSWSVWGRVGGVVTSTPSVTSTRPGTMTVSVRGNDGALWTNTWDGAWSVWSGLGGQLTTGIGSASRSTDSYEAFSRGVDNAVWWYHETAGWRGWSALGGTAFSAPVAVSHLPGAAAVFIRGSDGALWWQADTGQGFGVWGRIGGSLL